MLLALGGICAALSVIVLWASSVITINTLALLALSSCFVGIMHIEGGIKYSLLTFGAVSLLAFLLPVDKLSFLCYLCFFGYYPILKSYIERLRKLPAEIAVKTLFFAAASFLGVYAVAFITGAEVSHLLPWQAVALLGIVILHIFDYALSIFFGFYINKIRNKIKR